MDILKMLNDFGITYTIDSAGAWAKVACVSPDHNDAHPSASINLESGFYRCSGCGVSYRVAEFFQIIRGATSAASGIAEMKSKYGVKLTGKTIAFETVEKFHKSLAGHPLLINELAARAVSESTIRTYRIGENHGKIYIPIRIGADFVGAKLYSPGAKSKKMVQVPGFPINTLYPNNQLDYSRVLLCGGEVKALAAIELFSKHQVEIGAVSGTQGETSWNDSYTDQLRHKDVTICYDIDGPGRAGAKRVAEKLMGAAASVRILKLDLDAKKHPKGDINDYLAATQDFATQRKFIASLFKLPLYAAQHVASEAKPDQVVPCSIVDAKQDTANGATYKFSARLIGTIANDIQIPRTMKVLCDNSHKGCDFCAANTQKEFVVSLDSQYITELIDTRPNQHRKVLSGMFGIHPKCNIWVPSIGENQVLVKAVAGSPERTKLMCGSSDQHTVLFHRKNLTAFNGAYTLTGRKVVDMGNRIVFSCENAAAESGNLTDYNVKDPKGLKVFQSASDSAPDMMSKINSIYTDLANNVTKIIGRNRLHMIYDLAFHSPLNIPYRDEVKPGWLDVMVIGDSAQGKSDCVEKLQEHYDLGYMVDCCNATHAGLLGGVDKMESGSYLRWGAIPMADRQLCVMEEAKGIPPDVIRGLTNVRSKGVAQVSKIQSGEVTARTRLIWLSNPRDQTDMSGYNYPVEAVKEFFHHAESVRRLDLAYTVSRTDNITATYKPTPTDHVFTGALCRDLILWVWSLEPDDIAFESYDYIEDMAGELAERHYSDIPLLDPHSARLKVAKLSAALAARLYSREGDKLIVKNMHVAYIIRTLGEVYESTGFSRYCQHYTDIRALRADEFLMSVLLMEENLESMIHLFRGEKPFNQRTLDVVLVRPSDQILRHLLRANAIFVDGMNYTVNPEFLQWYERDVKTAIV